MKLLYAQGFSKSEKEEWRAIIFQNIQGAFKVIIDAMDELAIPFHNEKNRVSVMVHLIISLVLTISRST